uniref:CRIB domain-containing protein n=1 Tax=Nothoprocta perdicaria TaxID=30464 RepID=A0A8C6ZPF7_NOTPE
MPILKQLVSNSAHSKRRSRADLTAEMISAPLGDFRHTMHNNSSCGRALPGLSSPRAGSALPGPGKHPGAAPHPWGAALPPRRPPRPQGHPAALRGGTRPRGCWRSGGAALGRHAAVPIAVTPVGSSLPLGSSGCREPTGQKARGAAGLAGNPVGAAAVPAAFPAELPAMPGCGKRESSWLQPGWGIGLAALHRYHPFLPQCGGSVCRWRGRRGLPCWQ